MFLKYLEYIIQSWIYRRNLKRLENTKQMLTKQEEEKTILKQEIENLNQDAKMQHKELTDRIQTAVTELQKVKMEKESLVAELATKEKLSSF